MKQPAIKVSLKTLGIKRSNLMKKSREVAQEDWKELKELLTRSRDLYTIEEAKKIVSKLVFTEYDKYLVKNHKKVIAEKEAPAVRIYYTAVVNQTVQEQILGILNGSKLKDESPAPKKPAKDKKPTTKDKKPTTKGKKPAKSK